MDRSRDAERLWAAALELNKAVAGRDENVTPSSRAPLPPLWFVTDPDRTPRPWEIAARMPVGAGVIYRAFGASDAMEAGLRLRAATGGPLLVGLDADLAAAIGADGVHLPERALLHADAIRRERPDWRITGAVHAATDPEAVRALDAALVSPVFAPGGASAGREALGADGFGRIAAELACPAYALGGITADNARMLAGSGARGIAVVNAAIHAFGPD